MKTIIAILYAHLVKRRNKKWIDNPIKWQTNTFKKLIKNGKKTEFGKNHDFENIKSYEQYKDNVEGLQDEMDDAYGRIEELQELSLIHI